MRLIFAILMLCLELLSLDIDKPKTYQNQNIDGWYMSEKLDGIRAFYDGKHLLTKNGNIIHAPKTFTQNFPDFFLDGELWTKRNDFEHIQSIVLDKKPSAQWRNITYNIFESPFSKGDFAQRLQKVQTWFENHPNKNITIITQIVCQNKKHLDEYLEEIVARKGEGVIIKNPHLPYISKRNSNSLKVKKFYDTEGTVIGMNSNQNGTMKSLRVKLPNQVIFNLGGGFSKQQRLNPPKIGEVITFKYYGLTKRGKPKFASFLRIRDKE